MSAPLETLDVRIRRGTYQITTRNTRYYVEAHKSPAGAVRVISNGALINSVMDLLVGGFAGIEPVITVDDFLNFSRGGVPFMSTSLVLHIDRVDDSIDDLLCERCKAGYQVGEDACGLCRWAPEFDDVLVSDLYVDCSFPIRPNPRAQSDYCRADATSAVVMPDSNSPKYSYRCDGHEGMVDESVTGEVLTALRRRKKEPQPD